MKKYDFPYRAERYRNHDFDIMLTARAKSVGQSMEQFMEKRSCYPKLPPKM